VAKLTIKKALRQGVEAHKRGQVQKAHRLYAAILKVQPKQSDANHNMGLLAVGDGKIELALPFFKAALEANPRITQFWYSYIVALIKLEKLIDAKSVLDQAKVTGIKGADFDQIEKRLNDANQALSTKSDYANAHNGMGIAIQERSKMLEAIEAYNKALGIKRDFAEVHNNMSVLIQNEAKMEEAIGAYSKVLALKPHYESLRAQKLYWQAQICDWNSIAEDLKWIPELGTTKKNVQPFFLLTLEDAPERHRTRSKIYANVKYTQKPLPARIKPSQKPKRIRIGYFSADFKEHPVAYLIAKVLKQHNRDQFEVFGYSIHGSSSCEMRQRLEKSFDSFTDLQSLSDRDIALQARQDEIDIAVDLNGYTLHARTGIFAYRAAPIQINYLGYPGTLGADFMDYIVADRFIIPSENQKYFNEKPLYLPNTYLPTDDSRELSQKLMNRSDMGLPKDAFVFCCFNNNYKISQIEFDIWMRLLIKVENSVLWLNNSNQISNVNMKNEALKWKIDPSRLVFADKVTIDEHLARHKLADLFIDTFAYNAHTTATEALWAGLPVVTKIGLGFAARVAGSLLNAVGLPELVTETEKDYEALILELATNPIKLAKIKEKLESNRLTQPLFNTELYTKHLENGYLQAYKSYFDGKPNEAIIVPK